MVDLMKKTSNFRSYTELSKLKTFEERFEYLRINGEVAVDTFGSDRYLNQKFYKSKEWGEVRNQVILRDSNLDYCFDMGDPNYPISGSIIIHHMNPIQVDEIDDFEKILNPEYLICVSDETHKAIHYGKTSEYIQNKKLVERKPNDTCPWKGV